MSALRALLRFPGMRIRVHRIAGALLVLLLHGSGIPARADGPHIAFHETQGPYTVTLFSAPDPLIAGPVDLTLLVQGAADGALMPSVQAMGQLTLPSRGAIPFSLLPGSAGNPQLLAATVRLPQAGTYGLHLRVTAPGLAPGDFHGTLPVAENHGRRTTVLWAVSLPAILVGLFLANQYGKAQLRRARVRAALS